MSDDFVDDLRLLGFSQSTVGVCKGTLARPIRTVLGLIFPFILEFFYTDDVVALPLLRECEVIRVRGVMLECKMAACDTR